MKKKKYPINLNIIFMRSFSYLLLFFIFSCNQTSQENKYNGKWILQKQYYNEDIIFKDGNYTKRYSHDDLRVESNGSSTLIGTKAE